MREGEVLQERCTRVVQQKRRNEGELLQDRCAWVCEKIPKEGGLPQHKSILDAQPGVGQPLLPAFTGAQDAPALQGQLPMRPSVLSDIESGKSLESEETSEDKTRDSADVGSVSGGSTHYLPANDVILRLEYLTARQTKAILLGLWVATTLGWLTLISLFLLKFSNVQAFTKAKHVQILNAIVASLALAVLSCVLFVFSLRVIRTWREGKVWKWRRRRFATLAFLELVVQWCSCALWLAPNIFLLRTDCQWFSVLIPWTAFGRWTCFNTTFLIFLIHAAMMTPWNRQGYRSDYTVMDASLSLHWPAFLLWGLFEASLTACIVNYVAAKPWSTGIVMPPGTEGDCNAWAYNCSIPPLQWGLVCLTCFFASVYFAAYLIVIYRAQSLLRARAYSDYKMGNLAVRLNLRLRTAVVLFFSASLILLWFAKPNTCQAYVDTWAGGLLPIQVVATAVSVAYAFFAMPRCPHAGTPILEVWLQEFAWTACDKLAKLATRNAGRAACCPIQKEPLFVVQTALELLYWASLVYDYEEAPDSKLSLEVAMDAFKLTDSELFWEKRHDTKLLLAWNDDTVVVAFRGTASLANALADLQAWRERHLPIRGSWWKRPRVHTGFNKSWRAGGLDERVTGRVVELLREAHKKGRNLTIYVTGHSLGGALATLACFDFAQACRAASESTGDPPPEVVCYTFGAPRVGNHAFARECELLFEPKGQLPGQDAGKGPKKSFVQAVPDTWHLINDLDVVAKAPKFVILYKRHGQRVLIDVGGDMLVRPSFVESSLRSRGASVQHHLLGSYRKALLGVILAQKASGDIYALLAVSAPPLRCARGLLPEQVSRKRTAGGGKGVLKLLRASPITQELVTDGAGLSVSDLARMHRWGPALAATIAKRVNPDLVLPGHQGPTFTQKLVDAPLRGLSSLQNSLQGRGRLGSGSGGRLSSPHLSLAERVSLGSPAPEIGNSGGNGSLRGLDDAAAPALQSVSEAECKEASSPDPSTDENGEGFWAGTGAQLTGERYRGQGVEEVGQKRR